MYKMWIKQNIYSASVDRKRRSYLIQNNCEMNEYPDNYTMQI